MDLRNLGPTLDVTEAAAVLKVHPQTVLDKIEACEIPAGKAGRGYVMLTRDVLAHAEKLIIDQTAERMRKRKPAANDQHYVSGGVSRRPRRSASPKA